jgi:nicotinamidase-related amidase
MLFPEKSGSQRSPSLMDANRSVLIIIDAQEKFCGAVENMEVVGNRIAILTKAAARLGVPVLVTEQYPKALGSTMSPIAAALPPETSIHEKLAFSACDVPEWANALRKQTDSGRDQLLLCGVETHVCVLQTALDLARNPDAAVYVVEDAVSSRKDSDKKAALHRMETHGSQTVTVEMVIFEWLRKAGTSEFKELQGLVK